MAVDGQQPQVLRTAYSSLRSNSFA